MAIALDARPTLTAVEMDRGDVVRFGLTGGGSRTIELLQTGAKVLFTTLSKPRTEERGARSFYEFTCRLRVQDREHTLRREVPTQQSFYQPWVIDGVRIWLDAVDDIFEFLTETHGRCRPGRHARLAFQDAGLSICPQRLWPWCPLPKRGMDINLCYLGEDCWLGPYFGCAAHAGLDINHRAGTPICAPIDLDDHYYFNSVAAGDNNNRWRGHRRWPDGSQWILGCHHMTSLTVPEHTPLAAGTQYANGAGVHSGYHAHSHFTFTVCQDGREVLLDPWILFWQMYRDQASP